ncbi:DUF6207 family protein [Streptomyces lavenduligriseus]|uniref:DUF6207 family protein n=1 Tax=Streptomyces lavenduligriseus TaxID=67315 RepID=A0ABT0P3N5_9ACTN|nr:DUF6207 family protein [Streptomyces lavenduligriseus]
MGVAAADDETALAVRELLAARCAIAPADRTMREPGEPGVRLRFLPGPAPGGRPVALRTAAPPRSRPWSGLTTAWPVWPSADVMFQVGR